MNTKELEKIIYKNYDWSKVNYEMTTMYIPSIKFGKVIKVNDGDIITIGTKLTYIDDSKEIDTTIYRFIIYLDGISSPKITLRNNKDEANISKDELSKLIFGKMVEIKSLNIDKNGNLYATIFLDSINVNEWMLEHKYVIKHKKVPKRHKTTDLANYDNNKYENLLSLEVKNKFIEDIKKSFNFEDFIKEKTILPSIKNSNYLSKKTDCFLSHNWGENNSNHKKISLINKALQKRGLITWFDENNIEGNIRYKMAEGIDNTSCVIVFITKEYRDKVNGIDMKDNCKYEFTYSMNQLGSQNMIPIVMDKDMCITHQWKGELGAALGSMLYINFTEEKIKEYDDLEQKYDDIYNRIIKIIKN